ncbi:hypothetical protein [Fusobacterium sp.]|nr:hypothetical protein [Fusobacterium sp.]
MRDIEKTDEEIELQMEKAIDKIPWEIKKIKIILSIVKTIRKIKGFFKI